MRAVRRSAQARASPVEVSCGMCVYNVLASIRWMACTSYAGAFHCVVASHVKLSGKLCGSLCGCALMHAQLCVHAHGNEGPLPRYLKMAAEHILKSVPNTTLCYQPLARSV